MKRISTAPVLACVFFASITYATIINVPGNQPTIQAGINAASVGDTVLVQPNTYIEAINFSGRNITVGSLYLTTGDTSYISLTTIDASYTFTVVTFNSGENGTAVLSGFTVTNGYGNEGGGILCDNNSNPVITSCHIDNNSGQGIYCYDSSPLIDNCRISSNTINGMYVIGSSNPEVTDCMITDNASYGVYIQSYSANPNVTGNNISFNGSYPVMVFCNQISNFTGNTYTGNTNQMIYVVGGNIFYDTSWEDPGIPYLITVDIEIQGTDGVDSVTTLTLDPGITMRFNAQVGLRIGAPSPFYSGALSAIGTPSNKITFTANTESPSPGWWDGIYFYDYSEDSLCELEWCVIEYGGYSSNESIHLVGSSPTITHTNVGYGGGPGIYCYNGSNPIITDSQIHHSTSHGLLIYNSSATVIRCATYANNYGINVIGTGASAILTNITSVDNQYGVNIGSSSAAVINNSIMWDNTYSDISYASGCTLSVTYSDVERGFTGTGNIDTNPLFIDPANDDYHLSLLSPCIDTGDPLSPLDSDSTRADMGAFFFDHYLGSPIITAITDVPEDQGRYVIVTWQRSLLDSIGASLLIAGYGLWEMYPFETDGGAVTTQDINEALANPELLLLTDDTTWVHIDYIPAMQWEEYNALAETFRDSSNVEDNPSHFFVSAHTTIPYWHYQSEIDSGYSVDNIPPNPVIDATITHDLGLISINWSEISEGTWQGNSYPELNGVWYRVYGSTNPGFTPNPGNLLMVTDDPEFQHEMGTNTKYFYIIQTSDDH